MLSCRLSSQGLNRFSSDTLTNCIQQGERIAFVTVLRNPAAGAATRHLRRIYLPFCGDMMDVVTQNAYHGKR